MEKYYKNIIDNQLSEKLNLDTLIIKLHLNYKPDVTITNNIIENEKKLEGYRDEIRSIYRQYI